MRLPLAPGDGDWAARGLPERGGLELVEAEAAARHAADASEAAAALAKGRDEVGAEVNIGLALTLYVNIYTHTSLGIERDL